MAEVASAVLAIFPRALGSALREASPYATAAVRDAQPEAISFPQRFGSSLNPHYCYLVRALDGVVSGDVEHAVRFHEATGLEVRDSEALARTVQLRTLRWFTRRGLLDPATAADMPGTRRRRVGAGPAAFPWTAPSASRGTTERVWSSSLGTARRGPLSLERLHASAGNGGAHLGRSSPRLPPPRAREARPPGAQPEPPPYPASHPMRAFGIPIPPSSEGGQRRWAGGGYPLLLFPVGNAPRHDGASSLPEGMRTPER